MGILDFLKKQPLLKRKLKSYSKKDFEFMKSLKDRDVPFLYDNKFLKLINVIEAVLEVQQEIGKHTIVKKSKEIGYNVLDSNLAYGYYYGFCDAVIVTSKFREGMVELFYLWVNVIGRFTKVTNDPREFVDYFAEIQTKLIHDKKNQFYIGCISGGQDAMDWMKGSSPAIMGLITLLEKTKKIKDK